MSRRRLPEQGVDIDWGEKRESLITCRQEHSWHSPRRCDTWPSRSAADWVDRQRLGRGCCHSHLSRTKALFRHSVEDPVERLRIAAEHHPAAEFVAAVEAEGRLDGSQCPVWEWRPSSRRVSHDGLDIAQLHGASCWVERKLDRGEEAERP